MSLFYVERNSENAKDLFYKKTMYYGNMELLDKSNLVNFNFAEKILYGRVDRSYIPMVLNFQNPNMTLSNYNSTKAGEPMQGVNFVVEAFNEMTLQFAKCLANGQLNEKDKYLTTLTVHRAYVDPMTLYARHRTTYYESIKNHLRTQDISILDFDDCIRELMVLLEKSAHSYPLTLPAFVKSKWCPINASGLAVEIAELQCDNDVKKIEEFVQSPNWDFYLETCNSYGFMVDQNVPWRLVCDLASPTCLAENYGFEDLASIIQFGYRPAPLLYFENFIGYLYHLYTMVKTPFGLESVECDDGSMSSRVVTSQTYTHQDLATAYDPQYFLNLYLRIRLLEEHTGMTEDDMKFLVEETLEFAIAKSTEAAILRFEQIINKPFDIVGSLSYTVKQQLLLKDQPDEVAAAVVEIAAAEKRAMEQGLDISDSEWAPQPGWSEGLFEDIAWQPVSHIGIGLDNDPGALD